MSLQNHFTPQHWFIILLLVSGLFISHETPESVEALECNSEEGKHFTKETIENNDEKFRVRYPNIFYETPVAVRNSGCRFREDQELTNEYIVNNDEKFKGGDEAECSGRSRRCTNVRRQIYPRKIQNEKSSTPYCTTGKKGILCSIAKPTENCFIKVVFRQESKSKETPATAGFPSPTRGRPIHGEVSEGSFSFPPTKAHYTRYEHLRASSVAAPVTFEWEENAGFVRNETSEPVEHLAKPLKQEFTVEITPVSQRESYIEEPQTPSLVHVRNYLLGLILQNIQALINKNTAVTGKLTVEEVRPTELSYANVLSNEGNGSGGFPSDILPTSESPIMLSLVSTPSWKQMNIQEPKAGLPWAFNQYHTTTQPPPDYQFNYLRPDVQWETTIGPEIFEPPQATEKYPSKEVQLKVETLGEETVVSESAPDDAELWEKSMKPTPPLHFDLLISEALVPSEAPSSLTTRSSFETLQEESVIQSDDKQASTDTPMTYSNPLRDAEAFNSTQSCYFSLFGLPFPPPLPNSEKVTVKSKINVVNWFAKYFPTEIARRLVSTTYSDLSSTSHTVRPLKSSQHRTGPVPEHKNKYRDRTGSASVHQKMAHYKNISAEHQKTVRCKTGSATEHQNTTTRSETGSTTEQSTTSRLISSTTKFPSTSEPEDSTVNKTTSSFVFNYGESTTPELQLERLITGSLLLDSRKPGVASTNDKFSKPLRINAAGAALERLFDVVESEHPPELIEEEVTVSSSDNPWWEVLTNPYRTQVYDTIINSGFTRDSSSTANTSNVGHSYDALQEEVLNGSAGKQQSKTTSEKYATEMTESSHKISFKDASQSTTAKIENRTEKTEVDNWLAKYFPSEIAKQFTETALGQNSSSPAPQLLSTTNNLNISGTSTTLGASTSKSAKALYERFFSLLKHNKAEYKSTTLSPNKMAEIQASTAVCLKKQEKIKKKIKDKEVAKKQGKISCVKSSVVSMEKQSSISTTQRLISAPKATTLIASRA